MKQFECYDCGSHFDYQDMPPERPKKEWTGIELRCPYCESENVEDLLRAEHMDMRRSDG